MGKPQAPRLEWRAFGVGKATDPPTGWGPQCGQATGPACRVGGLWCGQSHRSRLQGGACSVGKLQTPPTGWCPRCGQSHRPPLACPTRHTQGGILHLGCCSGSGASSLSWWRAAQKQLTTMHCRKWTVHGPAACLAAEAPVLYCELIRSKLSEPEQMFVCASLSEANCHGKCSSGVSMPKCVDLGCIAARQQAPLPLTLNRGRAAITAAPFTSFCFGAVITAAPPARSCLSAGNKITKHKQPRWSAHSRPHSSTLPGHAKNYSPASSLPVWRSRVSVRSMHSATSSRGKGRGGRPAYSSGRVVALLVPPHTGSTAAVTAPAQGHQRSPELETESQQDRGRGVDCAKAAVISDWQGT